MKQKYKKVILNCIILLFFFIIGCNKKEVNNKPRNITTLSKDCKIKDLEDLLPLTIEEKLEDFEYLYKMIEENYPYLELNKRKYNYDWLSRKELHSKLVEGSKDMEEFIGCIGEILKKLNNSHTHIVSKELYNSISLQAVDETNPWLDVLKEEKVIQRYDSMNYLSNHDLEGRKDNHHISENLETKFLDTIPYIKIKTFGSEFIEEDEKVLNSFYKQIKDSSYLIVDIRGNGGGDDYYWMNNIVSSLISDRLETVFPLYTAYRGEAYKSFYRFIYKDYDEKEISIDEIKRSASSPPELNSDYFDYAREIVRYVEPKNSINYKGRIYLLVDDKVYSSADAFASFAKSTEFATLVGIRTKGGGIGSSPLMFSLPNSGLVVRMAVSMGLNPEGSSNEEFGTIPDVPTRSSSKALDKALELIELDKKDK